MNIMRELSVIMGSTNKLERKPVNFIFSEALKGKCMLKHPTLERTCSPFRNRLKIYTAQNQNVTK